MTPLDELMTEHVDERYANIDTASVAELARIMNDADALGDSSREGRTAALALAEQCQAL